MEFYDIGEREVAYPGEYVFHVPTRTIVLCGAFDREKGTLRALTNGRMITDTIKNFQKIKSDPAEWARRQRGCKGCQK